MSAAGGFVGLLAGVSMLLVAWWWRDRRPLPLKERIGPFVGIERPVDSRRTAWGLRTLLARRRGVRGAHRDHPRQLRWAAIGAAAATLAGVAIGATSRLPGLMLVIAAGSSAGWWLESLATQRRQRRRQRAIRAQLPMVADLVALALSAGTSPMTALATAAAALPGPLSDEIDDAVRRTQSGGSLQGALAEMAQRSGVVEVRRFVDALILASDLGTPMGEVARAQAMDIRVSTRRRWMEEAGRKDVAMLVPIVFLVLPAVVVVALFPGLTSLRLVVP